MTLVLVFGLLGWFYSARVLRSVALSLREKEFIEAARMVGSSNRRIIRTHVFPHLVGPLIVLATLNVAAFILAEAGLSFLGLGIQLPTASWGNLLTDAPQYYTSRPLLMVWPGIALLLHHARVQPARRRPARRLRPEEHPMSPRTIPAHQPLRRSKGAT